MTVWSLAPGCEHPVTPRRRKTGPLSTAEIIRRCEDLGARVEPASAGGYRVFPPDRARPPVSIPSRLTHGRGHLNVVTALRRAGLDVTTEPVLEKPMPPTPTAVPKRRTTTETAALDELREQVQAMLGMLVEAETRDQHLATRLDRLAARVDATPGAPPERDPLADVDDAILDLMGRVPVKLNPEAIAANLPDADVDTVRARLATLAGAGKVVEGPAGFYGLPTP